MACAHLAAAYGSSCFVVIRLLEGGAAEAWNERCYENQEPWRRLQVAAAILSVNGISGDIKRMQQELETAKEVSLTFCNPPNVFCLYSVLRAVYSGAELPLRCLFWRQTAQRLLTDQAMKMQSPSGWRLADKAGHGHGDLSDLSLSVIITTSPVPSNPSTEMLERVLASLPGATAWLVFSVRG